MILWSGRLRLCILLGRATSAGTRCLWPRGSTQCKGYKTSKTRVSQHQHLPSELPQCGTAVGGQMQRLSAWVCRKFTRVAAKFGTYTQMDAKNRDKMADQVSNSCSGQTFEIEIKEDTPLRTMSRPSRRPLSTSFSRHIEHCRSQPTIVHKFA